MAGSVELPVTLPGVRAIRWTSEALYAGMKEHYALGRVNRGHVEWWGKGKAWRSSPGSILVKQPGDVHRDLRRDGPTTWTVVTLLGSDVAKLRDARQVLTAQIEANDERGAPFHRLFDAVDARADRLALGVAVAEAIDALSVVSSAQPDHTRPVRRAMDYLRERLADSITLDDLADHAELDKFHLCRAFRAQIGLPPHAYLTHLRIARAKELLRRGVRATDVASLVGIYDQAQLTRHFRRIVGTTPARYGKMAGEAPLFSASSYGLKA